VNSVRRINAFLGLGRTALLLVALHDAVSGAERHQPDLIAIGASPQTAALAGCHASGKLQFKDESGKVVALALSDLVRWSTPAAAQAPDELLLRDGSRVRLAAAWGKEASLSIGRAAASAKTYLLGELGLARGHVRAVFWQLPPADGDRQKRIDELLAAQKADAQTDVLLLDNGDLLTGTLARTGESGNPIDGEEGVATVKFVGALGEMELPLERVRGIAFSPATAVPPAKSDEFKSPLYVGLSDGSLVAADSITGEGDEITLRSQALGERHVQLREIVSLQADGDRAAYLSDFEPADYRHEPYLDLMWPLGRDRNVLGGVPIVGERRYLKTVAMHSAARATYKLDGTHKRFAASVAVDDAADGGGSVAFRVYLRIGDFWQTAYASRMVRGGDSPRHIAVDLADARELTLVVDYADRGDERDYANWLDARLERVR